MAGKEFEAAVESVKGLEREPSNEVRLRMYALYKQATGGDASGKRPGVTNFVGRMKYDAWAGLAGTSPEDAEAQYVAIVADLTAP